MLSKNGARLCISCSRHFHPRRADQVRCKSSCRKASVGPGKCATRTADERRAASERSYASGRNWAANEMRAAVFLLQQGWEVCLPVAPTCAFDMLAWKPGTCLRVQVKTATEARGRLQYTPADPDTYDLLVLALPDRLIFVPEAF